MSKKSEGRGGGHKAIRSSGSPRHTETVGPGPVAGSEEQEARGPGSSMESRGKPDEAMFGSRPAASGKGKVPNHTRGDEEDGD